MNCKHIDKHASSPSEGNFCDKHGKAWNQPLYKTIIDTWDMCTNLTAWWTLTLPYHSQQLYHSRLLWFNIITLTIQTDTGEGLNRRGGKGALTSDHKTRKTSPIREPSKQIWHKTHWLMQCKRIWCHVCSAKNKETRTKFKCWECNIRLCATQCFKVHHTKLHFWGPNDTKMEKRNTQM